jgi:hypothetical protein
VAIPVPVVEHSTHEADNDKLVNGTVLLKESAISFPITPNIL